MSTTDPADLIKSISDDIAVIIRGEIELAKAELIPQAKSVGLGAGLFGGAGYLGLVAAGMLFTAAGLGVGALLVDAVGPLGAAALGLVIVAVLMLIVAGVLALLGSKKVKVPGPTASVATAKASVESLKLGITRGLTDVKNGTTRQHPAELAPVSAATHSQVADPTQ